MKLSIVIPAHNEEKRIGNTLKEYSRFFEIKRNEIGLDYEIIVVINATSDKTEEIVLNEIKTNKRVRYLNLKRGGKGYAVIEGFKESLLKLNDFIGFVDADGATSPEAFYDLVKNIKTNDCIIASRYLKGSKVYPKPTRSRIFVSRLYNALIRAIFLVPYRDTQCGAKLFTREAIKSVIPKATMSLWAFDLEILYLLRKNGFIVKEYQTVWSDKEYSKINFMKSGPWMVLALIRLRIIHSPLKKLVRVYDKFISFVPK